MASKKESPEELVARLNADLENFIAEKIEAGKKRRAENPSTEEDLAKQLELLDNHPLFMKEIDPSKPMSPELEAIMNLKYQEEDPTAKAEAYKDDGNYEFKKKKYDVAIDNYTVGITAKCPDRELNAILYSNRAAAHYHLGNYRSALRDCVLARKFKGDHMKAIVRGAMCCNAVKRYKDASQWCDAALMIDPTHQQMLEIKKNAQQLLKQQEKESRREEAKERKEREEELKLLSTIQSRGIQLAGLKLDKNDKKLDPLLLTSLEVHNPSGAKVHTDEDGSLLWPVLFMYPEHGQTDYIEAFNENHRFADHICHMFGSGVESPPWDQDKKYTPDRLQIYYEDKETEVLYKFSQDTTLLEALKHKRYVVHVGTPSFIILVDKSPFQEHFLNRYSKVKSVNS